MAKKNKPELTLEELQAKKGRRQRGWVRFCAIVLAVLMTFGIYKIGSSGEPHTVPLYAPSAQQVVVQNQSGGDNTDTPATTPSETPSTSTPSTDSGDSSESGGILDMLMGLLGGIDLSSIAGMLDLDGLGVKVADGIDSLQSMLIGLLDRIEESFTGKPAITHDPKEYDFIGEVGDEAERAAIAEMLNNATSDAALESYMFNRNAQYTENGHVDVGDQTEALNQVLSVVGSLDDIVGDFAGVGSASWQYNDETAATIAEAGHSNYLLKATSLTADDIQIVSSNVTNPARQTYTIRLKNVDNPNRAGETGFSRFTDDYLVQNEIEDKIANAITLAGTSVGVLKLTDLEMAYSDISVQIVYNSVTNQLQSLSYAYTAYGKFTVRTNTVQIVGAATTYVTNSYSNFSYAALTPAG